MDANFDPLHRWLGIPPEEQPPDHYRLLGIAKFEPSTAVIDAAADRQIAFLRVFETGTHAALAKMMVHRISAARSCLVNRHRRAIYDAHLKNRTPAETPAVPANEHPADVAPGVIIGEYQFMEQIATSRTGRVFKAVHRSMGRIVAVKALSRENAENPQLLDQFYRKVRIMARLYHPNLVMMHDAGSWSGRHFAVMELVDGQDMVAWMKQCGNFSLEQTANYIAQAALGLGHAHSLGVYHRNIKPSNLVLDNQGVVRVIGFSMARIDPDSSLADLEVAREIVPPGTTVGTLDYMAPEQAEDSNVADARSDIYGLGCTMFALLTGQLPYPTRQQADKIQAHRSAPIPSLCQDRPEIPQAFDAVFRRMVAKTPEERFQSMQEVHTAIYQSLE